MEQLAKALVNLRKTLRNPKKSSQGYNWRYANLVQINEAIHEPLIENGLTYYQTNESVITDGKFLSGVKTVLLHESGEQIETMFLAPPKSYDEKDLGGQSTYFRRYALLALFGLAPEDGMEIEGENNAEKIDDRNRGFKVSNPDSKATDGQIKYLHALKKFMDDKEKAYFEENESKITKQQANDKISKLEKLKEGK